MCLRATRRIRRAIWATTDLGRGRETETRRIDQFRRPHRARSCEITPDNGCPWRWKQKNQGKNETFRLSSGDWNSRRHAGPMADGAPLEPERERSYRCTRRPSRACSPLRAVVQLLFLRNHDGMAEWSRLGGRMPVSIPDTIGAIRAVWYRPVPESVPLFPSASNRSRGYASTASGSRAFVSPARQWKFPNSQPTLGSQP